MSRLCQGIICIYIIDNIAVRTIYSVPLELDAICQSTSLQAGYRFKISCFYIFAAAI